MSKTIRRLLRWASLALFFCLCLEVAARIDDRLTWGMPILSLSGPDDLREVGPDGIPRNAPGARFEKWKINSLGFRGVETTLEKPPGRRRVVVLGQSESFGLYESEDHEWPARLANIVDETLPGTEVINASVVGTRRWSRFPYLERQVFPLAPDLLVLVVNPFNEIADAEGGPKPVHGDGRAPRLPTSRMLPKLKLRMKQALPPSWMDRAHAWLLQRSLRRAEQEALGGRPPLDVVPADRVASYERHLGETIDYIRSRGIVVIVATYPMMAASGDGAGARNFLAVQRIYNAEYSEAGLLDVARRMNQATRDVAGRMGVAVVDLERTLPPTKDNFADLVHYTDGGADAVAAEVLRAVKAGLADR